MDFRQLLGQAGLGGPGQGGPPQPGADHPTNDNAETIYISSLALLKMLKHGRAGVPLEVMGLLLGSFEDDFTVRVIDVFAMPQSGTGVSVEAVDPVFQTKMLDMLKQTGRPEMVVGWYHSHPGFGCWLSSVDVNTQQKTNLSPLSPRSPHLTVDKTTPQTQPQLAQSFEQLNPRAVAVVVDPIQSVKGKVVIDAFRSIPPQSIMMGLEPRQSTSNVGHLGVPSIQALIHGLNRHYYSLAIAYRKTEEEQSMLLNLHKRDWTEGLRLRDWGVLRGTERERVEKMLHLTSLYSTSIKEESTLTSQQLKTRHVGKQDPKRHLEDLIGESMGDAILQTLGGMLVGLAR
ncbi:putative RPN11-26S proteasome regulatory subunit [Meredithblackwellia eburnea MCA 4105]